MEFEHDRDSLEAVFTNAMTAFGQAIARDHFGEEGMDWNHSGGSVWGGQFAFDFRFAAKDANGEDATFQVQIIGIRNMEPEPEICTECGSEFEPGGSCDFCAQGNGCPECARSYGPNYHGPCDH